MNSSTPQALGSSLWWRVAGLRPRLQGHLQVHRHVYRGQPWFVVEDRAAGRHHRFNLSSYGVIDLFDGVSTLESIWQRVSTRPAGMAPTQDEIVQLLSQLHAADLLQVDITPDVAELLQRRDRNARRQFMGRYVNPMALRLRLWDPDRALQAMLRAGGRWLGWPLALLWLLLVVPALVLLPSRWDELTNNFSAQVLSMDNLLIMALVFPVLKLAHEMAHGLAVRRLGGEVHEMGLMLLVFFPVPYVDASAASAFADKRDRMLVGAAGMLAELLLAAVAFYAWMALEPGLTRTLAYNAVLLGGLTTLLFNANPLLRFDGYYILADAIELPNLAQRANQFWLRLGERRLLGVPAQAQAAQPEPEPGERRWFWFYAPASLVYRVFVSLGIALFVATQYFFFGVALAIWALWQSMVWPVLKGLRALFTEPRFRPRWQRVQGVLAGSALLLVLVLMGLPLPRHTVAQGVLWLPEDAIVRAGTDGFVSRIVTWPGTAVQPGDLLLVAVDPELGARLAVQTAMLEDAQARFDAAWGVQPALAEQLAHQVAKERAALRQLEDEAARLNVRAGIAGTLVAPAWNNLPQRHVKRGEVLGYLVQPAAPARTPATAQTLVRVVLPQGDVQAVRTGTRRVELQLPQHMGPVWQARLVREVPGGGRALPSAALGSKGGGPLVTDPSDRDGLQAMEQLFEFELALPPELAAPYIGSRVHVRFEHPPEPLGPRWGRELRRLFLTQFTL